EHGHNHGYILRADGRSDGKWYDYLFTDNYSYAINDISSSRVNITNGTDWAILNFTWNVEPALFRSVVYLSRGYIEKEAKKEWKVYNNHPLLIKGYDLMKMRNDTNYTICVFRNVNYTDTPNFPLRAYYCNSSYDVSEGIKVFNSPNCVYLYSLTTSDLDTIYYSSRNSSYSKTCFGVYNGSISGINTTEEFYFAYYTEAPIPKSYNIRYVNGTSGTNVSFADTNVVWYSTNDGIDWTQGDFTPDIWFSGIIDGDQLQIGVYVEDTNGFNYTNYTFYTDDIGIVNMPITTPDILWIYSDLYGMDEYFNSTHSGIMTIHVGVSKDPNGIGIVNHSLYLTYPNGTIAYTINSSFYSPNDKDLNITFNTSLVPDGKYRINITAIADDNSEDIKSFLTPNNFTIDNNPPTITILSPTNITYTSMPPLNFTLSDISPIDKCWYSLDNGITNISLTNCNNLSQIGNEGHNVLIVYANDTNGFTSSYNVNFTLPYTPFGIIIEWIEPLLSIIELII
ncbi:MAG: hypothetical protein ACTSPQ_18355, partial [Candidatus Helarchaeota archaeon]